MAISKMPPVHGVEDDPDDDGDVVAALASGDRRRALTLLMNRHGERIYRYALGMTGDREMAEEIRQLAFVQAYRDLESFAGRSRVRTWLFGIARHRCLDVMKGWKRWNHRYKHDPPSDLEVEDHEPDGELDRHRLVVLVAECLRKLRPAIREAVMLRFQQELSYAELAAVVGEQIGTVQQRVARALPMLRKCVDAELHAEKAI